MGLSTRIGRILTTAALLFSLGACKLNVIEEEGPRSAEFSRIGNSQTIVFIHGMYLTPAVWNDWQNYFEAQGYETHAPAWPLHEFSVEEQNQLHPNATLGELSLKDVLNQYRAFINTLDEKPIAIGHSMGGLVAQMLLEEGLLSGAIAIHSAPPYGVLSAEPEFLKANWPMLNPLISVDEPIQLTLSQFQYGFANGMEESEQQAAYEEYLVPESRRVGRATTTKAAQLQFDVAREPLLLIAGGIDRTITARLNYANFQAYRRTPAITDFRQFPQRNHWTIGMSDWQSVANYIAQWIEAQR
ncbi:MAG TPA: alpha/beta hydrolase [Gammaproteobacteria bacterium]|nr:alpha/beta hydrolase [Gammaproteobacteria bacterium]HBO94038.1 alpha/beta hydrolase [Gammaproteobacteria bacterium]